MIVVIVFFYVWLISRTIAFFYWVFFSIIVAVSYQMMWSILQCLQVTYRARLFGVESSRFLTEAGVHHRVESVSREGTAGIDTQAGQRCLW